MKKIIFAISIFIILSISTSIYAGSLSGVWRGVLYWEMEMTLKQKKNKLKGYCVNTYDGTIFYSVKGKKDRKKVTLAFTRIDDYSECYFELEGTVKGDIMDLELVYTEGDDCPGEDDISQFARVYTCD